MRDTLGAVATTRTVLDVSLPRARHLMKFPRSQGVRAVRVVAAQLAERAQQTLAVSLPLFLARAILLRAPPEHVSPEMLAEGIEILSAATRPGDAAGFAPHELQHLPDIRRGSARCAKSAGHHFGCACNDYWLLLFSPSNPSRPPGCFIRFGLYLRHSDSQERLRYRSSRLANASHKHWISLGFTH